MPGGVWGSYPSHLEQTVSRGFFELVFHMLPPGPDLYVRWGPVEQSLYISPSDILEGRVQPIDTDLYFGPAVHSEPDGTKATVIGSSVAWCDYDGDRPPQPLIRPTAVVASGGKNHFHFYWALDSVLEASELEDVNKALAKHMGQKGGEWDASRVLRVPGTINSKYDPPRQVKVIALQPTLRYSPDLLKKLGPVPQAAVEVQPGKTRSERDYALVRLLVHWGMPDEVIEDSLKMVSSKAREEQDHYIQHTLKRARENKEVPIEVITDIAKKQQFGGQKKGAKPDARALCNFYVEPIGRLIGPEGTDEGIALRVTTAEAPAGEYAATQKDFEGKRSVHNWLSRNGLKTCTWLGRDADALHLFRACVAQCPENTILKVSAGGRHDVGERRIFIYGERDAITYPENDATLPVLWDPNTEPPLTITMGTGPFFPEDAADLFETIMATNVPEVVAPALGWLMGTPLKPVFHAVGARYPLLMVFGAKGSGKSTFLEEVLLPLLGLSDSNQYGKLSALGAGVSKFALLSNLAIYNAIPLWIGDFRSGLVNVDDLTQELRLAYDGHKEQRGRSDLTVSTWELSTPVVVDGEALFTDSATRDRCVPIRMSQRRVRPGTPYRDAYFALRDEPRERHEVFAREYLTWCLTIGVTELKPMFRDAERQFSQVLPFSRAARNIAVTWTGLKLLERFLEEKKCPVQPFTEVTEEDFLTAMSHIYLDVLGTRTPAELFTEIVASLYFQGVQWARQFCDYDPEDDILWVQVTSAHHWVGHFRRNEIPSLDMMLPILEERIGIYLLEPRPLANKGGGHYWGIDIKRAQELGLNVPRPTVKSIEIVDDTGDNSATITVNL